MALRGFFAFGACLGAKPGERAPRQSILRHALDLAGMPW